jgi:hypothetical protein
LATVSEVRFRARPHPRERELTPVRNAALLRRRNLELVATTDGGKQMPKTFLALAVVSAVFASGSMACAQDYPFCIRGCEFGGGLGDCRFSTFQQCQATASGQNAYCAANPYFNAKAGAPPSPNRVSPKRL